MPVATQTRRKQGKRHQHRTRERSSPRGQYRQKIADQFRQLLLKQGYRCEPNEEEFKLPTRRGYRRCQPALVVWSGSERIIVDVVASAGDDARVRDMAGIRRCHGQSTVVLRASQLSRLQNNPGKLHKVLQGK